MADFMSRFHHLKLNVDKFIARLTLARPPVNALDRQMIAELNSALEIIENQIGEKMIRIVIIDAEGGHFCAGADLKERRQIPSDQVEEVVDRIRSTFRRIYQLPVPVLAAVQGSSLGGGLELVLAADFRVVTNDARLGLPETGLAIIPGAGGTQRLARLIGAGKALFWIASAKIFTGLEAFEAGVAEFVVKKEELKPFCTGLAGLIARNGPVAVQAAKQAIRAGLEVELVKGLEIEKENYRKTIGTEDRLEGIRAVLEKRAPDYKGE